jgi:hypothetical protein
MRPSILLATLSIASLTPPVVGLPVLEPASIPISTPVSVPTPAQKQTYMVGRVSLDEVMRRNGHYMPKDPVRREAMQSYIARSLGGNAVTVDGTLWIRSGPDEHIAVGLATDYFTFSNTSRLD